MHQPDCAPVVRDQVLGRLLDHATNDAQRLFGLPLVHEWSSVRIIHVGLVKHGRLRGALREPVQNSVRLYKGFNSVRNPPFSQRLAPRTLQFTNNPGWGNHDQKPGTATTGLPRQNKLQPFYQHSCLQQPARSIRWAFGNKISACHVRRGAELRAARSLPRRPWSSTWPPAEGWLRSPQALTWRRRRPCGSDGCWRRPASGTLPGLSGGCLR